MINIKKSSSVAGLVFVLLITITMFTGAYLYLNYHVGLSGVTLDPAYNETYTNLQTSQDNIAGTTDELKDSIEGVVEADSAIQVAINGMRGIGKSLKLTGQFASWSWDVSESMIASLSVIPSQFLSIISIGVIIFTILLIIAVLKGDNDKVIQ